MLQWSKKINIKVAYRKKKKRIISLKELELEV